MQHSFAYPGQSPPSMTRYFDRRLAETLPVNLLDNRAQVRELLRHAEQSFAGAVPVA